MCFPLKVPGGAHQDPKQIPIDLSPSGAMAGAGPPLVVVNYGCKIPSATTIIRELTKTGFATPKFWRVHSEPNSEVGMREGGAGRNLGFCFYYGCGQCA